MKAIFKPLGLATAVAAVTAGYAGVSNAETEVDNGNLGDLGIIPYYTVQENWVTGIHITNTSNYTQAVKLRLRRGSDSMDALDFNIILSPYDMWTGLIKGDNESNITLNTGDNSCTAPYIASGKFPMPVAEPGFPAFNEGAMEGYIEIIGMGEADDYYVEDAAEHGADGVPADCVAVEENFFRYDMSESLGDTKGVYDSETTFQSNPNSDWEEDGEDEYVANDWDDTPNVLSVSYFIRDNASGVEFGSNAVMIRDFANEAMMSNQARLSATTFDPLGFYFPDLDGGGVDGYSQRGRFDNPFGLGDASGPGDNSVRDALGADLVLNDWSVGNADNQIQTDWVITMPGQYLMVDFRRYVASLFPDSAGDICLADDFLIPAGVPGAGNTLPACDYRDIPVVAAFNFWDREEQKTTTPEDGLVISPATGAAPGTTLLKNEVNVIKWDDSGLDNADVEGVLNSAYSQTFGVSALGAENGWASLAVTADDKGSPSRLMGNSNGQAVCNVTDGDHSGNPGPDLPNGPVANGIELCMDAVNTDVPMVGFAAWQRTLPNDPSASYGRIIEHSSEGFEK